jgi:hypothetical protein
LLFNFIFWYFSTDFLADYFTKNYQSPTVIFTYDYSFIHSFPFSYYFLQFVNLINHQSPQLISLKIKFTTFPTLPNPLFAEIKKDV